MTKSKPIIISKAEMEEAYRRQVLAGHRDTALSYALSIAGHEGVECIVWPFARYPTGYGKVRILKRVTFAHRLICSAAHGPAPSHDHEAAHSCGRGHDGCINPQHLRWATHVENVADKEAHGTHNGGTRHASAKLNEAQVREIRRHDFSKRGSLRALAIRFGVSHSTICRVRDGAGYREKF